MYNYPDKIEISVSDTGEDSGEIKYDPNTGAPVFPGTTESGEKKFNFLSDCRIEENNSYTLSGTYVYSFNVYLPKNLDASRLPGKDATIRLTKKDLTVKDVVTTVVDSKSTRFNYVIKT